MKEAAAGAWLAGWTVILSSLALLIVGSAVHEKVRSGNGIDVGVLVGVCVLVGVTVLVGVPVAVCVGVGVWDAVGVAVGLAVAVAVAVLVKVGVVVPVAVAVAVDEGVAVLVAVGVVVITGSRVGVGIVWVGGGDAPAPLRMRGRKSSNMPNGVSSSLSSVRTCECTVEAGNPVNKKIMPIST